MPLNLTRSILVIIIPGGVAVGPWLVLVFQTWPEVGDLYEAYPILWNCVFFGIVVIVGTIFENFGSSREVRWDKNQESTYDVQENWYRYLSREVDPEPVGYRYISRMVTSLYFELTMTFATISFFLGSAMIAFFSDPKFHVFYGIALIIVGLLLSIYFEIQATQSHGLLCKTRKEINQRLDSAP